MNVYITSSGWEWVGEVWSKMLLRLGRGGRNVGAESIKLNRNNNIIECSWIRDYILHRGKKVCLDKKRIIWINPNNGFSIAALKDLEFEIQLPNTLPSYKENFEAFRTLWTSLEYDIELLYENVQRHHENQEYCCLDCHFPFATVCSELYTQFEPDFQDHPVE